ncbi:AT-rich interactive domain-containing protein 3A [Tenrec ecaudatus]|uniref:AT-rich interactive domain-containing protein 3A n=1 Tax=Tenrec ecaudatus TaxID=94439 RepID=UPI003F5AA972
MKLQAVMETLLQRQQRARQELEARQPPEPPAGPPARARPPATTEEDREPESTRMQQAQMAALAAMRAVAAGLGHPASPRGGSEDEDATTPKGTPNPPAAPGRGQEGPPPGEGVGHFEDLVSDEDLKHRWEEEELEEDLAEEDEDLDEEEEEEEEEDYEEDEDEEEGLGPPGPAGLGSGALFPRKAQPTQPFRSDGVPRALAGQERQGPGPAHPGGTAHSVPPLQPPDHGDWTYEEQFKQLYELDGDPKRKEFLDDLFSFMQKRGTPVNRIPIMAKQVLDLFMLYVLVTEKGGLVEVINKKLWREITKGLNLPTSITSAAFTLRTQYMKYLYPYECEKRGLSSPSELQAAIDSNRREGRRQGFGGSLFTYSPGGAHSMLSSPKLPVSSLGLAAGTNGSSITPAPKIKKEEDAAIPITVPGRLPVSLAGHPVVAAQAAVQAAAAAQAAALEHLREKLESGEPPEKKMALVSDEQQRFMQRALQQNFLAMTAQLPMSIRINSQASDSRQDSAMHLSSTNGSSSISMSVEINGVMYTGVLFAQAPAPTTPTAPSKGGGGGGGGGGRGGSGGTSSSGGGGSSSSSGSQAGPPPAAPSSATSTNSVP